MNEFNDTFMFKDEPDETTPLDADNLNVALNNTRFLKNKLYADTAGNHNSIFRGKDITNYYNDDSLWERISSGKFTDLYVGDYILKNGITWRIAGFDVYLNKGQTRLTTHHAIIVPDSPLQNSKMNDELTTEGGYVASTMFKTTLNEILEEYVTPVFKTHVLDFMDLLTNKVGSDGKANGYEWQTRNIELMTETMFFGSMIRAVSNVEAGCDTVQLPLFRLAPEMTTSNRNWIWLRNIVSLTMYAEVGNSSQAYNNSANVEAGVRPYFYID